MINHQAVVIGGSASAVRFAALAFLPASMSPSDHTTLLELYDKTD